MVIKCTLDASGNVRNVPRTRNRIRRDDRENRRRVCAAWKFQPAMRGNQPVEVTAILGFNIDTNDRYLAHCSPKP